MTVCFINFIICGTAAGTDHVILMQSTTSHYKSQRTQFNENVKVACSLELNNNNIMKPRWLKPYVCYWQQCTDCVNAL